MPGIGPGYLLEICSGLDLLADFPSELLSLCRSRSRSRSDSRSFSRSNGALLDDRDVFALDPPFPPVDETGRATDVVTVVDSLVFLASDELIGAGLDFLLAVDDEMGTSGGISLGGTDLNPGFLESRFESLLVSLPGLFVLASVAEDDDLSLDFSLSFLSFSKGGMMDLDGEGSLPILLHVCASKASGLFLASN